LNSGDFGPVTFQKVDAFVFSAPGSVDKLLGGNMPAIQACGWSLLD
jgi:hypothetical protein